MSSQPKSVKRTSVIFMAGGAYHRRRLFLQEHAVARIHAEEEVGALRDRLRGHAAKDKPAAVPVEMILGEVTLEDAAPHPGRPHVVRKGRSLARELKVHGARGEDRLLARAPAVGHPVD